MGKKEKDNYHVVGTKIGGAIQSQRQESHLISSPGRRAKVKEKLKKEVELEKLKSQLAKR